MLVAALLLAACAATDGGPGTATGQLAASAGMQRERIAAGPFQLTAFLRITRPDRPVSVYIEGDGLAWISRTQPSLDPTPTRPTGLQLAAADPGPNVVYLARPCQFTPMDANPACNAAYWTGRRFSETVVSAMNAALDEIARRAPGQPLHLVGYSGGGAIAALLAARRADVASLRTVAGNLDSEAVNRHHGVSAMPESLNPIDIAPRLATLPQVHLAGAADAVVPRHVAWRFVDAQCRSLSPCPARIVVVPHVGHDSDWVPAWRQLGLGLAADRPDPDHRPPAK